MSDTADRIRKIVADLLGQDVENVTATSDFAEDLGATSLDVVEIVVETENAFGFELDDEAVERVKTVAQLAEVVEAASR